MKFQSTKVIDGFSCCFRQEKSAPIRCSQLHGYSIKFKIWFEGELDHRNWVVDFGFLKRSNLLLNHENPKVKTLDDWFKWMFDHTVIIAEDDTQLDWFKEAEKKGILQLRILSNVGCERFAELVFNIVNDFIYEETGCRVKVVKVECFEHENNSAIVEAK